MNEQEKISDFLLSEKKMTANYDIFAAECVNVPLRDEFLKLFHQGHMNQSKLFQVGQKKGWYKPENATTDQVQTAYTKFSDQAP